VKTVIVPSTSLGDYDPTFLVCRDVQHTWPDPDTWKWNVQRDEHERVVSYSRSMMCQRCHTIGRDVIDASTGQGKRTYRHPAGYSMPKGHGVSKRDVRLEQLRRIADTLDTPKV
jgi:hypothetical protein